MVCETVITNTVYQQVSAMENGDLFFMLFGRLVAIIIVFFVVWAVLGAATGRS